LQGFARSEITQPPDVFYHLELYEVLKLKQSKYDVKRRNLLNSAAGPTLPLAICYVVLQNKGLLVV
jgi:hypothetical protein